MGTFTFSTTAEAAGTLTHTLGKWDQAELTPGKYVAVYQQVSPIRYFARVANVVDDVTSPTFGAQQTVESAPSASQDLFVVALSSSKVVVMYHNAVDSKLTMRVLNIDGSDAITVGTAAAFTLTFQPLKRFNNGKKHLDAVSIDASNFYLWNTGDSGTDGSTWLLSKFNVSGDTITLSGSTLDSRTLMGGSWNFEQDFSANQTWKISKTIISGAGENILDTATTWNPADSAVSLSGGNLIATNTVSGNTRFGVRSIFSASSGKYYWETVQNAQYTTIGIAQISWSIGSANSESLGPQITYYNFSGGIFTVGGGAALGGSWVNTTYTNSDVISVAVDLDNGKIWFGKNGAWLTGDPAAGTDPAATFTPATWFAGAILQYLGANAVSTTNFGATAFTHPELVPTGYVAGLGSTLAVSANDFIIQSSKSIGVIDDEFNKIIDLSSIDLASSSGIALELSNSEYIYMEDNQKLQFNTGGVWGADFDFSATNFARVRDTIRIDDTHFGVIQTNNSSDEYLQFVRKLNNVLWQHQTNSILSTPFPEQGFDIFETASNHNGWWQNNTRTAEIGEMIYAIDTENFVVFHSPTGGNTFEMTVVNQPQPVIGPDLPTLNNLDAHYDAQDEASVITSGSNVTQWNDISGNNRHQTNSFGTRPTLEVNAANGFDCIRFTGNSFTGTSWTGGDCTITAVLKYNPALLASVQFSIAFGFGGDFSIGQWDQSSNTGFGFNNLNGDDFGNNDGKNILTNDYTVVSIYVDSGNVTSGMRLFFNSVEKAVSQIAGSTSNAITTGTTFDIGDIATNGFPMRGDICEIYLNAELLGDSDNLQLIEFLKDKWAIPDLDLVGDIIVNAGSGALQFPFDTQEGDLAVVLLVQGSGTAPILVGAGWTLIDSQLSVLTGSSYSIYSKTLVQADLDTPATFTVPNGGFNLVVYRNHNSITFKGNATGTGGTIAASGFTKDANSARVLAFYVDRDPIISVDPAGFREIDNSNITFFNMAASDILSSNYAEGSITWTVGGAGSGFGQALSILEIT